MTATDPATGNPIAPPLPELSPKAEVALLARTLHREGYDDHLAGHITSKLPDGTFLCNPFGLTWDEIRAGDIMRIDLEGNTLEGPWTVSPAIELHLALHRTNDDIGVAVHNHPEWGTIWADMQRVPPVYDQTSSLVAGEIAMDDEYEGVVAMRDAAEKVAKAVGHARMALLKNHGVLVMGDTVAIVHHRAVTLEWRCRNAWRVEAAGGGVPLRPDQYEELSKVFDYVPFPGMWEAMARRELRRDPSVLEE